MIFNLLPDPKEDNQQGSNSNQSNEGSSTISNDDYWTQQENAGATGLKVERSGDNGNERIIIKSDD